MLFSINKQMEVIQQYWPSIKATTFWISVVFLLHKQSL